MCFFFHVRRLSNVMPKYLTMSEFGMGSVFKCIKCTDRNIVYDREKN